MKKKGKLSSNMEDYLEAIADLKKKGKVARVKDIAAALGVETPSVTSALKNLSRNGLVVHERYGYVDLTAEGSKLAKNIQKRHEVIHEFLTRILQINKDVASEDACAMEHALSPETFKRLTKFMEFVEACPIQEGPDWLNGFKEYCASGRRPSCKLRKDKGN